MLHMVVLCLAYSVHSFVLMSLIGDTAFHVAGTSTELVDFPNRSTLYSADVGEIQVDSGLCRVFTMGMIIVVPSWILVEAL